MTDPSRETVSVSLTIITIIIIYYHHLPSGAAGLDSSIFAHLKRNWTWNNSANYRKGDKLASPPFIMSEVAESGRCVSVNTTKGKTKVI